jgi:hypothetical protein
MRFFGRACISSFLRVSYRDLSSAEGAGADSDMVTYKWPASRARRCLFIFESDVIEYACRPIRIVLPTSRMSSAPPPPTTPPADSNKKDSSAPTSSSSPEGVAMDVTPDAPVEETWDDLPEEILTLSTDEILTRTRLIDNDIKVVFE